VKNGRLSERQQIEIDDVAVAGANGVEHRRGGCTIKIDLRNRGVAAIENDVLGFLHVHTGSAPLCEDVRQNAGTIAVPDNQRMGRTRSRREVDDVGNAACRR
jgi:hypothetical protein